MTLLMDPSSFNGATVLRHATRPDILPGSIYCTAAEVMEPVLGCSGGELTMVIEIMKSLEESLPDIHPRLCHYPPCWQAANGSLVRLSKTVHQTNARGFVNRALYNNTAGNLFTAGTKTSIDHLYARSSILFGVGPKIGGRFKPMFAGPGGVSAEDEEEEEEESVVSESHPPHHSEGNNDLQLFDEDAISARNDSKGAEEDRPPSRSDVTSCDQCNLADRLRIVDTRYTAITLDHMLQIGGNDLLFHVTDEKT